MTYRILHEKDGTIIVTPANELNQTATIVICHGLGDTAEGFADVAEVILDRILFGYTLFTVRG